MDMIQIEMHRAQVERSASLPQVIDGDRLKQPELRLKVRPNGKYAVYRGATYLKGTGTEDEGEAKIFLEVYKLQNEARKHGIVDVRYAPAREIVAYYLASIPVGKPGVLKNDTNRLNRLKPHLEGRRLCDLNDAWKAGTEKELLKRYTAGTVQVTFQALRTGIKAYCKAQISPLIIPFDPPTRPPGRDRVLTAEERSIVLRWANSSENYDAGTGIWTSAKISKCERNSRLMVGRLLELGLPTGGRGGRYQGLAWKSNRKTGHIDVATGLLHRLPAGASAEALKQAPPVLLPPALLAKVRAWKKADGDQPYVFRTRYGGPATTELGRLFSRRLKRLGIFGVTLHTLRHTCITALIEQGVPPAVISAICGISVQVLMTRYNHSDGTALQPLGHASMDAVLTRK